MNSREGIMVQRSFASALVICIVFMSLLYSNPTVGRASGKREFSEVAHIGQGTVNSVAWEPHSQRLAIGGTQGIYIYHGSELVLNIREAQSRKVLWSPSGKYLSSADGENLHIWDASVGQLVQTFTGSIHAWAPQSDLVAIAVQRMSVSEVQIRRISTGEILQSIRADSTITDLSWSRDGSKLGIADVAGHVVIYNFATAERTANITLDAGIVLISFSPTGQYFATAVSSRNPNQPNSLQIWNSESGQLQLTIQANSVSAVAWSADETMIATGSLQSQVSLVRIWEVATGKHIRDVSTHYGRIHSLMWSPDNTRLLSAGEDNVVKITSVPADEASPDTVFLSFTGAITSVDWVSNSTGIISSSVDGSIRVWDSVSGHAVQIIQGHTGPVWAVDANGQDEILSGGNDGTVRVWSIRTGTQLGYPTNKHTYSLIPGEGNAQGVGSVAWNKDGNIAASGGYDGTARVRLDSFRQRLFQSEAVNPVVSVAWSPLTDTLSVAGDNVYLWEPAANVVTNVLQCDGRVFFTQWSPDGALVAGVSIGRLCVWDAQSGRLVSHLDGVFGPIAWHPHSSILAIATTTNLPNHNQILVWDYVSEETVVIDDPLVSSIAWSDDGSRLVSGGSDGILHIWQNTSLIF
jgi:WD40 repeat protein